MGRAFIKLGNVRSQILIMNFIPYVILAVKFVGRLAVTEFSLIRERLSP